MIFSSFLLGVWFLEPAVWFSIFKAAFGLGLVIFVHELGHFLVAKACGVKCEKFYIGFDVPISLGPFTISHLWKQQWGETEYGIGIIPLGGYVKMLGQDDNPGNSEEETERTHVRVENPDGTETLELDPRSYPAKNVPQRMAIISAGVIMNLIFAVIFATIAYSMGVNYTPTIVGATVPGQAAWTAGLQPGDKIVGLGKDAPERKHLRFGKDLAEYVVVSGADKPLTLNVKRGDKVFPVTMTPKLMSFGSRKFPSVGIQPDLDLKVGLGNAKAVEHLAAGKASPPLEANDKIVAVTIGSSKHPVKKYPEFRALLAQNPGAPIILSVERRPKDAPKEAKSEQLEIHVGANPMRMLGISLEMGPVTGVRDGSPAQAAGLKVGDVITQLNGEPVGDPITLPDRFLQLAGKSATLTVQRGSGDKATSETLTITPEPPVYYESFFSSEAPMVSDAIGVVYEIRNVIAAIDPQGPAADLGLQVGDRLLSADLVIGDAEKQKFQLEEMKFPEDPTKLGDEQNWAHVTSLLQRSLPETTVKLTVKRTDDKEKTVEITPVTSDKWFAPARGIALQPLQEEHQAKDFGNAVSLGFRETKESLFKVVTFLKKVVTGQMPITNFGGPGTIAVAATMEASEGVPRLLIFLTLLSANLAVVNFLPIPVLDGGHMVFLAWEGIFRRPIDEKWMFRLSLAGLSFILCLMALVISLDVYNLSGWAS